MDSQPKRDTLSPSLIRLCLTGCLAFPVLSAAGDPVQPPVDVIGGQSLAATADERSDFSPERIRELMRPSFDFGSEWQSELGSRLDNVAFSTHNATVKFPTYPIFGPPPPIIDVGFKFTNIDASATVAVPGELYETTVGLSWMRKINDRWLTRFMLGTVFATDGENQSSDAWRIRGGAFAVYRRSPEWTWAFGAIALGRNDIPVVPAVGLIYQPNPALRFELMMPKPRISCLLADHGLRQQWGYVGAGLNGSTWGVLRVDGIDDQLSYGDFRFVLGWESTPTVEPGMPFTRGRKIGAEIGCVSSRDFEFENEGTKVPLEDALVLRALMSF